VAVISTGTNAGAASPSFSHPSRANRRHVNNWLADIPRQLQAAKPAT
jgi:hypothetical protein